MSDRGMKKWAPYSSLIEQATCLEEMRYKRNKIEKPILSIDKKEEINRILHEYRGQILKITYWFDGYLYEISKSIKRVDVDNKMLIFDNGKLPFNLIVNIENPEFF